MKNLYKLTILCLALLTFAGTASAWTLWGYNWLWLGGNPITVNMKLNANGADANCTDELGHTAASMAGWTGAGANFKFYYNGTTGATNFSYNGTNEIFWNGGSSGSAIATTQAWINGPNFMECDIAFWDGAFNFSTNWPGPTEFDVWTTMIHELGHVVGLGHSTYTSAVMYAYGYAGEVKRLLTTDDIAGIQFIYGLGIGSPLTLTLTPNSTVYLPSSGGTINYTIQIQNLTSNTVNFAAWSYFLQHGGATAYSQNVINRPSVSIGGNATITRTINLTVAGSVPAGSYEYFMLLANAPQSPNYYDETHFFFYKNADLDGKPPLVLKNNSDGWDEEISISAQIPETFRVSSVFPNPFNPETTIEFDLPKNAHATLSIYNMQGQKVTDLISGDLEAGHYGVSWNAALQPSGTYIYHLVTGVGQATGKLVLLK